jgi:hypothetical protein
MVKYAKSNQLKALEFNCRKQSLEMQATSLYLLELEKKRLNCKYKSSRKICEQVSCDYKLKTGISIKLTHTTIIRYAAGQRTRAEANGTRAWLSPVETEVVIQYIIETGNQGFPLSHKRLKEHVDEICQVKYGEK